MLLIFWFSACNSSEQQRGATTAPPPEVRVVGAMRNVMWKGELGGSINLDTLADRSDLYGLGPVAFLSGEIMVSGGRAYVSRVASDSTIRVERTFAVEAPFFVYARVSDWTEQPLPDDVVDLKHLEAFVDQQTKDQVRPFAFKLSGRVAEADIHVQNLPPGTEVSSPTEAHQGQQSYTLTDSEVEIVGFFSTEHQGIFTHHDTFLHTHLVTQDERWMGHLDRVRFVPGAVRLYLPAAGTCRD